MPVIKTLYELPVAAARMLLVCASVITQSHANFLTNAVRSSEFLLRKAAPLRRASLRECGHDVPQDLHGNTTAVVAQRTRVRLWASDGQEESQCLIPSLIPKQFWHLSRRTTCRCSTCASPISPDCGITSLIRSLN